MAKDEAKPQDKGKGKAAEDVKAPNGVSEDASKDGKTGKKPGDLPEEDLSEEDQKLLETYRNDAEKQRDQLKEALRELETEQRKLDTELKKLRQREIRTKREIEALGTLIAMQEPETSGEEGA